MKRPHTKTAGLALAALLLGLVTACATTQGYQQNMDLLVGQPGDQIKIDWGIPDQITSRPDGGATWAYHTTGVRQSGNSYDSITTGSDTDRYKDGEGNPHTRTTTYYEPAYVPPQSSTWACVTRFEIGPDNRVRSYTFEGDCVAYKPKVPAAAAS